MRKRLEKSEGLEKVENFLKSKKSKAVKNILDDVIMSEICLSCGHTRLPLNAPNVLKYAAGMIANRLATKYIPGYAASKKLIKQLKREVKLKLLYLSESKAAMWYHTNKHKPVVLFGLLQWVNVYKVTRHYGGPEEGGWWYDQYSPVASALTSNRKAEAKKEALAQQYKGIKHGNISSVRGGADVRVYIEEMKGRLSPATRPHYE